MQGNQKIGVFDSGFGGLTVYKEIKKLMPQYDFVYLGDNARVPYGTRSFETVYKFTWQCVQALFEHGCSLVIIACNTASAKALRSIQLNDLPLLHPKRNVLGVIRPTTEIIGQLSQNGHVGILATEGTINSQSYPIEIKRFFPDINVSQQACPMWVPLIENHEHLSKGADYFIEKYLSELLIKDPQIDTIILACTHYPLLQHRIENALGKHINIISQGTLVANSLKHYLERHIEIDKQLSKSASEIFLTTESTSNFDTKAAFFLGKEVSAQSIILP